MLRVVISSGLKRRMNCGEGAGGRGGEGAEEEEGEAVRTGDGESLRRRFKALLH